MFKVLIVDDEPFIRLGLRKMVNWEEEGFTIVGEARNGIEALNLINTESIDLVITDISMPKMDGISFINELRKYDKKTKIVFLTGYKEFEYAKQGIRLGVKEYLLKPINPNELLSLIRNVKEILDEELKIEKALDEVNNKDLIDIIQGKSQDINIINKYFTKEYVNVSKVEIENFDDIAEAWIKSGQYYNKIKGIKDNIENILENECIFLEGELGNYYLVIQDNKDNIDILEKLKIINNIKLPDNIKLKIIIGKWVRCDKIYLSYKTMRNKTKENELNQIKSNKKAIGINEVLSKETERILIDYVIEGNPKVFEVVEFIVNNINNKEADIYIVSLALQNLVEKMLNKIKNEYGYLNKLFLYDNYDEFYKKKYDTNEMIIKDFEEIISEFLNLFGNFKVAYKGVIIRQACQYVVKNIDNDVSLSHVSNELNISKNYFCALFKNETGENFLTFVTRTKMERAKILLKNDNMKVYEVCDYLGYNDTTYFTRIFKKYSNMTPYEYKKIGG
ncbi:MAG: response regulator [Clostridium sp.]|uniref:response regulator transcription factor n=1 Tax=Clostridium sp. TaxID=1506 RepID=UPI0029073B32|nr:response regulator [Clostridium sp.]MDU7147828.1 response regulator [Clostridium sp.]